MKRRSWAGLICSLILFVSVWAVYSPSRAYPFLQYDDSMHVSGNPYIQPLTLRRLAFFWRIPFNKAPLPEVPVDYGSFAPPYYAIYTPLSFDVHAVVAHFAQLPKRPEQGEKALNPLDAGYFHTFNIILHGFNSVLLFFILRRVLNSHWGAGVGALLFALHPVQVEAIVWVTGQNNLLATLFGFAAVWFYLLPLQRRRWGETESDEEIEAAPAKSASRRWSYPLSLFLLTCALASKPTAGIVPLLILVLDFTFFERSVKSRIATLVPWFAITFVAAVLNKSLQGPADMSVWVPLFQRPLLVGDAFTFYLKQLVWPAYLVPDYGRRPDVVLSSFGVGLLWIIPLIPLLILLGWRSSLKRSGHKSFLCSAFLASYSMFFLALLPTSGIMTYYFHAYSVVADRYMYLALPGAALALGAVTQWIVSLGERHKQGQVVQGLFVAGLAVYFVALSLKSIGQIPVWTNDAQLWAHTLNYNSRSWLAWLSTGRAAAAQRNFPEAINHLQRAVDLSPDNWTVRQGYGDVLYRSGKVDASLKQYLVAVKLFPTDTQSNLRLGIIYSQRNKLQEAAKYLGKGLESAPYNAHLLANFGVVLAKLGQNEGAQQYLKEAMRWGFDSAVGLMYLGVSQASSGDLPGAVVSLQKSVALNPNFYETHYNLGLAYQKTGKLDLALEHLQQTIALNTTYAPAYVELARTHLLMGDKKQAAQILKDALNLDPKLKSGLELKRALQN